MEQKINRIPLWDNLKFYLIVLVVIGHFAEAAGTSHLLRSVFLFIYAFHMPAFFFVSGLFHSNRNIAPKVASFLALYILMKAIIYLELLLMGKKPSFSLFSESGIPWFMFAMAVFTLLRFLFRNVEPRFLLIFSLLSASFAGYDPAVGDTFVLSRILVFFPFYLLGSIIDHERLMSLRQIKPLRVLAAFILLIWGFICLFLLDKVYPLRPLFTGRNPFPDAFLPYGAVWRLLCYAVSVLLVFACVLLVPGGSSFTSRFGGRTLQVYFWHRIVLYILQHFGVPDYFHSLPLQIVWLLLSVPLVLLLSLKPFGFPAVAVMRSSHLK